MSTGPQGPRSDDATVARPQVRLRVAWYVWAAVVLLGVVVVSAGGHLLVGGVLMSTGFAFAALARGVLPSDRAGGVLIRGRRRDVAFHALGALAIIAATVLVHLRVAS